MCEYSMQNGKCSLTRKQCVWMYFCYKDGVWKALAAMPKDCKQKEIYEKTGGGA